MTDPEFADATYVEPITTETLEKVIAIERPDAVLPTLGGQTALNAAVALHDQGVLAEYHVELIGANIDAIRAGEDRERFKEIVTGLGAQVPRSQICRDLDECIATTARSSATRWSSGPRFTLGGLGSGIAGDEADLRRIAGAGLDASPTHEVLLEESIIGWKEFELELMRDAKDNVVVVCSIENIDPMGVHTGDSVTVAPAMTLTDREYQRMRDTAIAIMRAVGVDTGGCNIQFAVEPRTGQMVVIEMNPRVSRQQRAGLQGHRLPHRQDRRPAGHRLHAGRDPERHHRPDPGLLRARAGLRGGQGAAVRVREVPRRRPGAHHPHEERGGGHGHRPELPRGAAEGLAVAGEQPRPVRLRTRAPADADRLLRAAADARTTAAWTPSTGRCGRRQPGRRSRRPPASIPGSSSRSSTSTRSPSRSARAPALDARTLVMAKQNGFSDAQIAELRGTTETVIREIRWGLGVRPVYHAVDTCAAEFAARTPYLYSTYDDETEVPPGTRPKVIILGSGPNRIGQGIEFDYACVHASFALAEAGYETVMVNCNPETVSTDYDTSGRLYFEPLTLEDVLEVVRAEQATGTVEGVIVQLGGQTPLGLARALEAARVPIVGTSPEAIHLAEDRAAFARVLARGRADRAALRDGRPRSTEAVGIAREIGYPVLVRPSYVLGGRGMEIVYDDATLQSYMTRATAGESRPPGADRPLPRRRDRDRRRRAVRRDRAVPRRRDGAHRGGRHPFR